MRPKRLSKALRRKRVELAADLDDANAVTILDVQVHVDPPSPARSRESARSMTTVVPSTPGSTARCVISDWISCSPRPRSGRSCGSLQSPVSETSIRTLSPTSVASTRKSGEDGFCACSIALAPASQVASKQIAPVELGDRALLEPLPERGSQLDERLAVGREGAPRTSRAVRGPGRLRARRCRRRVVRLR